ncbi:MAG: PAS domain-containing sensor histidine kinase, partial [Bauldia sp.]
MSRRTFEFSRFVRAAGYGGVIIALVVACVTFFILMGLTPLAPTQGVVLTVLIVNGLLVAFLIFVIGWEIGTLVSARRRGRAAARLHIRIVALFSVVAATPAILVAVVASITLDRGLDNWFSTRTRAIVETSSTIAQAYVDGQIESFDRDILAIKSEIERARTLLVDDPDRFQTFLSSVVESRGLPGAFLVKSDGSVVAQAEIGSQENFPPPPPSALTQAAQAPNEPALIAPGTTNLIGGIVKLADYDDVFLYALRPIDPKVVRYLQMTTDSVNEFRALEATRLGIQLAFG